MQCNYEAELCHSGSEFSSIYSHFLEKKRHFMFLSASGMKVSFSLIAINQSSPTVYGYVLFDLIEVVEVVESVFICDP